MRLVISVAVYAKHLFIKMSLPKNAKSDADEKNVWAKCVEAFRSINLKELQNIDEKEIAIYNTEDGVLFNKEVIEKLLSFAIFIIKIFKL
jgi:hypothetical protein